MRKAIFRKNVISINGVAVDVARRIYSLRTFQGMTQGELAQKMGVTQGCVSSWESGRSTPRNFKRLYEALDVTEELFTGDVTEILKHWYWN